LKAQQFNANQSYPTKGTQLPNVLAYYSGAIAPEKSFITLMLAGNVIKHFSLSLKVPENSLDHFSSTSLFSLVKDYPTKGVQGINVLPY
jgi:hypothetical protein